MIEVLVFGVRNNVPTGGHQNVVALLPDFEGTNIFAQAGKGEIKPHGADDLRRSLSIHRRGDRHDLLLCVDVLVGFRERDAVLLFHFNKPRAFGRFIALVVSAIGVNALLRVHICDKNRQNIFICSAHGLHRLVQVGKPCVVAHRMALIGIRHHLLQIRVLGQPAGNLRVLQQELVHLIGRALRLGLQLVFRQVGNGIPYQTEQNHSDDHIGKKYRYADKGHRSGPQAAKAPDRRIPCCFLIFSLHSIVPFTFLYLKREPATEAARFKNTDNPIKIFGLPIPSALYIG